MFICDGPGWLRQTLVEVHSLCSARNSAPQYSRQSPVQLRQDHSPRIPRIVSWSTGTGLRFLTLKVKGSRSIASCFRNIACYIAPNPSQHWWAANGLVAPDGPPELLCGWRSWRYQKRHLFLQDALNHKIPSCSPSSLCTRLFSQLSRSCIAASYFSIFIRFPGKENKPTLAAKR